MTVNPGGSLDRRHHRRAGTRGPKPELGNLNAVHGTTGWNIEVSLVRDGRPVLAVLHFPLFDEMYTATEAAALYVRISVPVTHQLAQEAGGVVTTSGSGPSPRRSRRGC
jgi:fructose-1,6-bisphosphatase/inositol monophosphatase family enzyme